MTTPSPENESHFLDDPVRVEVRNGRRVALTSEGRNTERIVFFSDAVFAIAVTLLVLDIRLPEGSEDLATALGEIWQRFLAFCISFVVIAGTWLTHFRRFRLITGYDAGVLRWNTLLLFLICLVPFPTSVFADHSTALSTVLYGGALGSIFGVQALSWVHVRRAGLLSDVVDEDMYRTTRNALAGVALVFLLSLPFAFVQPWITWIIWSLGASSVPLLARRLSRSRSPVVGPTAGS